jgi:hypothetical protein
MRAALIPVAVIVPLSILSFGLVNKFVDGRLGIVLSLVCLFFNGVGVSGQPCQHIWDYRRLTYDLSSGGYDLWSLRGVSSRRIAFSKFRNLGSKFVRTCMFFDVENGINFMASVMRSVVVAVTIAASLPMIDTCGIAITYVLCAVLIWISFRYVFVSIKEKKKKLIR